jgi:hypothetical protein
VLALEIADGKMAPREKIIQEPKIPELMQLFETFKVFESYKLPFKTHGFSQLGVMLDWTKIPLRGLYKRLPENHEAFHIQKQAAHALENKNSLFPPFGFCNAIAELALENPPNPLDDDAKAYIYRLYAGFAAGSRDRSPPGPLLASFPSLEISEADHKCAHCGKSATCACTGCKGAPGKSPSTVYCNNSCQNKHWQQHKLTCEKLQARRTLQRSAALLKSAFLIFKELVFEYVLKEVNEKHGILYVSTDRKDGAAIKQDPSPWLPMPASLNLGQEEKEAILCLYECQTALFCMHKLLSTLLHGKLTLSSRSSGHSNLVRRALKD